MNTLENYVIRFLALEVHEAPTIDAGMCIVCAASMHWVQRTCSRLSLKSQFTILLMQYSLYITARSHT